MLKAYSYRLYPNKEQEQYFLQSFWCARFVYNNALDYKKRLYEEKKESISDYSLIRRLPALKSEYEWLKKADAQVLAQSILHMCSAYRRFFKEKKWYPKFKKRKGRESLSYTQGIKVFDDTIQVPKIGKVSYRKDRGFIGKVKTCTISKTTTNKYFISILVDDWMEVTIKAPVKEILGIDLWIKEFAVLSNGERIANPKFLKENMERLKILQRRASKKIKWSANRRKANLKVARMHERIANQRKDFLQKLSTNVVKNHNSIGMEDLNVKGMMKNHCLAWSIGDASWSEFRRMIEYKCRWYGKNLFIVDRFFPSSKLCTCWKKNIYLKLSDREWTCFSCGQVHDRDLLASQNIARFAGVQCSEVSLEMFSVEESVKEKYSIDSILVTVNFKTDK